MKTIDKHRSTNSFCILGIAARDIVAITQHYSMREGVMAPWSVIAIAHEEPKGGDKRRSDIYTVRLAGTCGDGRGWMRDELVRVSGDRVEVLEVEHILN